MAVNWLNNMALIKWRRLLLLLALIWLPGCASARHTAVVVDSSLYEALNDAHSLEQQTLCGVPSCANVAARVTPSWTDAKSQAFNRALLPAVEGGKQFNLLLSAWKPGQPMPQGIHDLITGIASSLTQVAKDFPEGTTKSKVLADIATAQSAALTALDLYLAVKGQ